MMCLIHSNVMRAVVIREGGVSREYRVESYLRARRFMKLIGCIQWKFRRSVITPTGLTVWLERDLDAKPPVKAKYRMVVYNHMLDPIGVEEFNDIPTMRLRAVNLNKLYYATQVFVLNENTGKYEALARPKD